MEVKKLKELAVEKEAELDDDDLSVDFVKSFYDHAEKTMKLLDDNIKKIDLQFAEVVKFFAEDPKKLTIENFIVIMRKLNSDMIAGIKAYKEDKVRREKAALKLSQKA